jgi:hypothetical protein
MRMPLSIFLIRHLLRKKRKQKNLKIKRLNKLVAVSNTSKYKVPSSNRRDFFINTKTT